MSKHATVSLENLKYNLKAFFVLSVRQVIESKDCSAKEVSFFSLMEGMVKLE